MKGGMIVSMIALPFSALAIPRAPMPAPRLTVQGVWKTECMPIGKNGRHGFITRLQISRNAIIATSQVYAHNSCDTPTVHTDYHGTLTSVRSDSDGVADFDHVVKAITMTADDPTVVTIYNADNSGSGCGFGGGWKVGAARAVNGRTCTPWTFPTAGTRLYERAWVAGDELRIGSFPSVWDNTTPEKRPTTPGMMVFHRVAA